MRIHVFARCTRLLWLVFAPCTFGWCVPLVARQGLVCSRSGKYRATGGTHGSPPASSWVAACHGVQHEDYACRLSLLCFSKPNRVNALRAVSCVMSGRRFGRTRGLQHDACAMPVNKNTCVERVVGDAFIPCKQACDRAGRWTGGCLGWNRVWMQQLRW